MQDSSNIGATWWVARFNEEILLYDNASRSVDLFFTFLSKNLRQQDFRSDDSRKMGKTGLVWPRLSHLAMTTLTKMQFVVGNGSNFRHSTSV